MIDFSKSRQQAKSNDDKLRRCEAIKALDYYWYRQKPYLCDVIDETYSKEEERIALKRYIRTFPLTREMVNELAICFTESPAIEVTDGSDPVNELWWKIKEESRLEQRLLTTDKMVELFNGNRIGVLVRWNPETNQIALDILNPDRTIVWQNALDHSKADRVAYLINETVNSATGEMAGVWAIWTDDEYIEATLKDNGDIGNVQMREANPYGVIPVSWFSYDDDPDAFWSDSGYPIIDANEFLNLKLTNLNMALDYQSWSLLATVGMPEGQSLPIGLTSRINIPPNAITGDTIAGSVQYLNPRPMLVEYWQIVNESITMLARAYGISAQSIQRDASSFSSGYQLKLSKQDVVKRNKLKRAGYRYSIRYLCKLMAMVYTIKSPRSMLPDGIEFDIDFGEITFEANPMEIEQINAMRLANGTVDRVIILREQNPDLTEQDAIDLIAQIDARRNAGAIPLATDLDGALA